MPSVDTDTNALPARSWRRWVFAIAPAIGVLELVLHVRQASSAVPKADWLAARDAVLTMARPDDLVIFAPHWADPLGRSYFGDKVATLAREARADDTGFARAIEVSIRGQHAPELATWKSEDVKRVGAITLTTLLNPAPKQVIDDLLSHEPLGMRVSRVDLGHEQECAFARGAAQTGNLGFGPAIPADKFNCAGAFVGISVIPALDYTARRCFYAPPPGGPPGNGVLRIRFLNVAFGTLLHGHHGIYVEAERNREGSPVTLAFKVRDRVLGSVVHTDGDGWKAFELPTTDLAGQADDLVAEVSTPNGNRRMYCFEADTR